MVETNVRLYGISPRAIVTLELEIPTSRVEVKADAINLLRFNCPASTTRKSELKELTSTPYSRATVKVIKGNPPRIIAVNNPDIKLVRMGPIIPEVRKTRHNKVI